VITRLMRYASNEFAVPKHRTQPFICAKPSKRNRIRLGPASQESRANRRGAHPSNRKLLDTAAHLARGIHGCKNARRKSRNRVKHLAESGILASQHRGRGEFVSAFQGSVAKEKTEGDKNSLFPLGYQPKKLRLLGPANYFRRSKFGLPRLIEEKSTGEWSEGFRSSVSEGKAVKKSLFLTMKEVCRQSIGEIMILSPKGKKKETARGQISIRVTTTSW